MSNEIITQDGEVISGLPVGYGAPTPTMAVALARAEIDQQVSTAHAYPRHVARVMNNILSLATLDDVAAEESIYALPRGGKPIKGPSIRLAEIIASQWGNCRVSARVVEVNREEKYVEAEGIFHDLETNSAATARVRRRIVDKYGKIFNDDMIIVTGNAASSIAKRNAILAGVPKAVWRKAYDAVEKVVAGDIQTLSVRREKAVKAFAAFGVTPDRLLASLGVSVIDDVNLEHVITLTGAYSAIKSGESTVEEMFPVEGKAGPDVKGLANKLDSLADDDVKGSTRAEAEKKKTEAKTVTSTTEVKDEKPKEEKKESKPKVSKTDAYKAGHSAAQNGQDDGAPDYGDDELISSWREGYDDATAEADGDESF